MRYLRSLLPVVVLAGIWLGLPAHAAVPAAGFGLPLAGTPTVSRGFTPPATAYGAGHRGVDLAATPGASVLAAGAGQVTYVGLLAGRGVVTVTHAGGLRTTYEPVTAGVRLGAQVLRGAVLGTVARGHASCGGATCLHWGLLRGDAYLDPLGLLHEAPSRLLPLGGAALTQATGPRAAGAGAAARSSPAPIFAAPPVLSPAASPHGRSVPVAAQAAVAAGALVGGTLLLARRPRDALPRALAHGPDDVTPPPAPPEVMAPVVHLDLERQRRRIA